MTDVVDKDISIEKILLYYILVLALIIAISITIPVFIVYLAVYISKWFYLLLAVDLLCSIIFLVFCEPKLKELL